MYSRPHNGVPSGTSVWSESVTYLKGVSLLRTGRRCTKELFFHGFPAIIPATFAQESGE